MYWLKENFVNGKTEAPCTLTDAVGLWQTQRTGFGWHRPLEVIWKPSHRSSDTTSLNQLGRCVFAKESENYRRGCKQDIIWHTWYKLWGNQDEQNVNIPSEPELGRDRNTAHLTVLASFQSSSGTLRGPKFKVHCWLHGWSTPSHCATQYTSVVQHKTPLR